MRSRVMQVLVGSVCLMLWVGFVHAQSAKPLAGVKTVQVDPTVVPHADKVKEEQAPNQVADSLRNALKDANFEIGEAPIRAHIVLDEFTSGNTAKRFMVGFGAGRSTVDCQLVIQDAAGKELVNRRIRVRGNLIFSPYQGNNTQRRQAVTSFEQRLIEEIEKLK
ncbi:MAG: DUF4410 domain-containing protein [Acidobacteriia bacterium]|nr:DUF4410 domain-containing protein [Terriglobia bacterium]